MRVLLVLALFVYTVSAEADKGFSCPQRPQRIVETNTHNWSVEKFLGDWNGIELYSHQNDSLDDTCMRLKISEVNKLHGEILPTPPSVNPDPYNHLLSIRILKLEFKYPSHSIAKYVSLNMTNVDFWSGNDSVVQVLKSDESQLVLTICNQAEAKYFTIILGEDIGKDSFGYLKTFTKSKILIRKLKITSETSLNTNCTSIINETESSAQQSFVSIYSALVLLLATFLAF